EENGDIVVVAGDTVSRYLPDGSLDATFGSGGRLTSGIDPSDVATESDGRIVVFGSAGIARYNPDGTLDQTFGDTGVVSLRWPKQDPCYEVASGLVDSAGRMVVVGGY